MSGGDIGKGEDKYLS